MGEWTHTAGKFYGSAEDKGIQTTGPHRFYGISAKLDKPYVSTPGKDLVIQYSAKLETSMECGGAYIKLLPGGDSFKSSKFGGDTPYSVMFGPDICGSRRTHVILHSDKKNDNLMIKNEITCENDQLTHLYTLVVKADNTFEVFIDQKSVKKGKLEDEFPFLEPKQIQDPAQSKPADWVDEASIPDPSDVKPEGYDDVPAEIPDANAKKPDDWDAEEDGEWEAPMVDNPAYKGPWRQKRIPNPDYKGPWVHPLIPNPAYVSDDTMYSVCKEACTHVGFELWQVTDGVLFDDIFVSDSLEEAQKYAEETYFKKKDDEKQMFDAQKSTPPPEPSKSEEHEGYYVRSSYIYIYFFCYKLCCLIICIYNDHYLSVLMIIRVEMNSKTFLKYKRILKNIIKSTHTFCYKQNLKCINI